MILKREYAVITKPGLSPWLNAVEASKYTGLCLRDIHKLVDQGKLRTWRPFGPNDPRFVFRRDNIDAYLATCEV